MELDYAAYLDKYEDLRKAFVDDPDKRVYTEDDLRQAKEHYEKHGSSPEENRSITSLYDAGVGQSKQNEDLSTTFDLDNFEKLLTRLEASKGRQQRQKSVEGRRDIFSQGLAGMMSNF